MPAMMMPVEAARVENAILQGYLTSEVALEESEIGIADPNIPIDNNCTSDTMHFGFAGGSGDFVVKGAKAAGAMLFPPPACDDRPQLNF